MSHFVSLLGRWRRRFWLMPVLALVVVLLLWPAAMLAVGAFRTSPPGMPGQWSWRAFAALASQDGIWTAARNSAVLAVTTTALALLLAPAFAFLSQRTGIRLRRVITPMMMIVFATPSLFYAMAYSLMGNRFNGYANALLRILMGDEAPVFDVESWAGLLGVTTLRATAFIYLFIAPAFAALDRAHEDASLVSGRGKAGTFLRVSLPILAPAITGAAILGLVAGLHAFDTVLILGEPAGIRVLATEIYDMLVHAYPPAYAEASLVSLLLVLLVGALCIAQFLLLGRRGYVTVTGRQGARRPHDLGGWRWLAGGLVCVYFVLGVAAPFGALVYGAFQPFPGVHGALTWLHFERVFTRPGVLQAVWTTGLLAVGVGALAMVFGVALALANTHLGPRGRTFVRFAALVPYAMPGIVAALAVTWAYVSVPGLRQIYGTPWMLVVAFIVVVMPFAMQAAQAAVAQLSPDLAAAARVSGASALRANVGIVGRLILPSFLAGWFFVAIIIAGNLDVPLLLGTPTLSTVASQIFILQSQGQMGDAAALVVSSIFGVLLLGPAALLLRRAVRARRSRLRSPGTGRVSAGAAVRLQGELS